MFQTHKMEFTENIVGANVFILANGLTITETVLVLATLILVSISGSVDYRAEADYSILVSLIQIAYLVTDYIGIHMKNKCLIIFGCLIRVLVQILVVISIIFVFRISDFCQEFELGYENCDETHR